MDPGKTRKDPKFRPVCRLHGPEGGSPDWPTSRLKASERTWGLIGERPSRATSF